MLKQVSSMYTLPMPGAQLPEHEFLLAAQEVGAVTNQAKQAYLRESRRFREAASADAEARTKAEAAAEEARAER